MKTWVARCISPKHHSLYRRYYCSFAERERTSKKCARRTLYWRSQCVATTVDQPSQGHRTLGRRQYYFRNFSLGTTHDIQHNIEHSKPGLYTIPGLLQPQDFIRLSHEAIRGSDNLRDYVSSWLSSSKSSQLNLSEASEILYRLDEISKTVCNVIDAAELCRSSHASEEWRSAAQRCFSILQDYIGMLNADQTLYESLKIITDPSNSAIFVQLSEEEQRFAALLKREFELDGIHLPDEQREQARQLQSHITNLETMFSSNITNSSQTQNVALEASALESVIARPVLEAHGAMYTTPASPHEPQRVEIGADSPLAHSVTNFAPNSELRKEVYMGRMTSCPENLQVLDALIKVRQEVSMLLGFPSYAERFLQDKMAKNSKSVINFLNQLQRHIAPAYRQEMNTLLEAKKKVEGPNNSIVEPWDVKFYISLLKASQQIDPAILAPYLSLENCLNALQLLVRNLFGIHMKEVELSDAERWDIDPSSTTSSKNNQERIRKFVFFDEASDQMPSSGSELGTMYLDLHPRQGKYTHAAHFTVRCGCVSDIDGSSYQLPIVALVCNMNTGSASFSSHQEVETLFHEFGHALHSMLSRTKLQHLSGTRASMDFVETPSHWMEQYVWDPQFLPHLGKHALTGDPIPEEMIQALQKSRSQFRCIEMQNQILLGSFDQQIFGDWARSTSAVQTRPIEVWAELNQKYGIPYAPGTHWFTNIGHLITYGAGYYGYLYSQVFANDIWKTLFIGRSLERYPGELIWKKLLIHGGAKDPNQILKDLLGRKPSVENFLETLSQKNE